MNNIEEMYELINPGLITSEKTLHQEMNKAYCNKNIMNNYLLACVHRLAQISKQKVFTNEVHYEITEKDYYIANSKDDFDVGCDCMYSETLDYHDGDYEPDIVEIADYTGENNENTPTN